VSVNNIRVRSGT